MEGYVYLLEEEDNEGFYKIGSTRSKDINKRLRQLQTGNPKRLLLKDFFHTNHVFKLESMLHNRYKTTNIINEWFELSEEDINNFQDICKKFQEIIDALEDNPFF